MLTGLQESDFTALVEAHQFVRDDEHDARHADDWKLRMSRRYYDSLYKEYAIIDLSRAHEGKYGLRWRTEGEVLEGKGEVICASKACHHADSLSTYELPFQYTEKGQCKSELVKVRLCAACAGKIYAVDNNLCPIGTDNSGSENSTGNKKLRLEGRCHGASSDQQTDNTVEEEKTRRTKRQKGREEGERVDGKDRKNDRQGLRKPKKKEKKKKKKKTH